MTTVRRIPFRKLRAIKKLLEPTVLMIASLQDVKFSDRLYAEVILAKDTKAAIENPTRNQFIAELVYWYHLLKREHEELPADHEVQASVVMVLDTVKWLDIAKAGESKSA